MKITANLLFCHVSLPKKNDFVPNFKDFDWEKLLSVITPSNQSFDVQSDW